MEHNGTCALTMRPNHFEVEVQLFKICFSAFCRFVFLEHCSDREMRFSIVKQRSWHLLDLGVLHDNRLIQLVRMQRGSFLLVIELVGCHEVIVVDAVEEVVVKLNISTLNQLNPVGDRSLIGLDALRWREFREVWLEIWTTSAFEAIE